jgi:murein L,D-transpeptidase YafK
MRDLKDPLKLPTSKINFQSLPLSKQYKTGIMIRKKTLCWSLAALCLLGFTDAHRRTVHKRFFNRTLEGDVSILVIKSTYELQVYDKDGWYATYPAVFGSKSQADKMMQGDRLTPEGTFHIISKRPHEKWDKIMDIDYPTPADVVKFNDRKARGLIPKSARIGDGIAIHGTWPHDDNAVDAFQNWTNGCVSLKREDMDELYEMTPIGTKVIIRH